MKHTHGITPTPQAGDVGYRDKDIFSGTQL
jgi:hypothetical protein